MLRSAFASALFFAVAIPASAHDLRAIGSKLTGEVGDESLVRITLGHGLPGEELVGFDRLEHLLIRGPSGSERNVLGKSDELAKTLLKLEEQGVYQGLVVGKAEIETKVEGADGKHRHVDGPKSSVKQGKVISATRGQKFAKTLIVVGRPTKAVEVSGLPFDIVPLDLPSKWRAGARLRFRVLYNGAPLADLPVRGAAVPAGEKPARENWTLSAKTDRAGEVSFDFSAGRWHLEAEREFAAEPARRADYDRESYVTSVSFEVRP